MSSNVGLTTPRGSGTSGYVQRNLSHLRPRDAPYPSPADYSNLQKHRQRKPNQDILDHDRLREIEVKVFDLRDKLEDEGVDEEEIETRTDKLRKEMMEGEGEGEEKKKKKKQQNKEEVRQGRLKNHQVHEMAAQKIEESEKLRRALGIREDYEEGSHWRRGEERLKEGVSNGVVEEGGKAERVKKERSER